MARGLSIGVLVILFILGCLALNAWLIMLLAGALGHIFNAPALLLSFWDSVIVSLAISLIAGFLRKA